MPKSGWLFYAFLSAFFASLTTSLAKLGVQGVSSTVATAIRTVVSLFLAWGWIFATGAVN
jgi:transporter family protein